MSGGVAAKTDLVDTIICLSLDHHRTGLGAGTLILICIQTPV